MKEELSKTVTAKSIALKGLTNDGFGEALRETIRSKKPNSHAVISFCRRTVQKYRKSCKLRPVKGVIKTSGRVNAYNNIRTHISLCAMLQSIQSIVNRVNFHSVDDVSILANPMIEKLQLITSQEAIDLLKRMLRNRE
jgi:hypothetical protein